MMEFKLLDMIMVKTRGKRVNKDKLLSVIDSACHFQLHTINCIW